MKNYTLVRYIIRAIVAIRMSAEVVRSSASIVYWNENINSFSQMVNNGAHNFRVVSDRIKKKSFKEYTEMNAVFMKNLSTTARPSLNTGKVIVYNKKALGMVKSKGLFNFIYTEKSEDSPEQSGACAIEEKGSSGKKKSILIISSDLDDRVPIIELHRAKEPSDIENYEKVKQSLIFTERTINWLICKLYAIYMNTPYGEIVEQMESFFQHLSDLSIDEVALRRSDVGAMLGCNLIRRAQNITSISTSQKVLEMVGYAREEIEMILENNKWLFLSIGTLLEIEDAFNKEAELISSKIKSGEENYNEETVNGMKKKFIKNAIDIISILAEKRIKLKDTVNMKEVAPWNAGLMKLLVKRVERLNMFDGSLEELVKRLMEEDIEIINELKVNREKEFARQKSIFILIEGFNSVARSIEDILKKHWNVVEPSGLDKIQLQKAIHEEKKTTKEKIINMLACYFSPDNVDKGKDDIQDMLSDIVNGYKIFTPKHPNDETYYKKFEDMFNAFIASMCTPICENGYRIEHHIKYILNNVFFLLIKEGIESGTSQENAILKEAVEKEEEEIKNMEVPTSLQNAMDSIIKHLKKTDKFYLSQDDSYITHYVGKQIKTVENTIQSVKRILRNGSGEPWIGRDIEKEAFKNIVESYKILNQMYSHFMHKAATYDEVWESPAVLVVGKDLKDPSKYRGIIIYTSEESEEVACRKEISLTVKSLNAFRNAKTPADIESIERAEEETAESSSDSSIKSIEETTESGSDDSIGIPKSEE